MEQRYRKHKKHNLMLENIKRAFRNLRNERFLKRWTARMDGDAAGKYYVKRRFDANFSFYDLYWEVKRKSDHQRMETIYIRADEARLTAVVKETEETRLPQLFRSLAAGKEE